VLARASAGVVDRTIAGEADAVVELRRWFGRPLWEMQPQDLDRFFGGDQRTLAPGTKVRKARAIAVYFEFLELRHRPAIHASTGHLVASPVDEPNRPRSGPGAHVRVPRRPGTWNASSAGGVTTSAVPASTRPPRAITPRRGWPA
jgi:integrase/recombinase XerD